MQNHNSNQCHYYTQSESSNGPYQQHCPVCGSTASNQLCNVRGFDIQSCTECRTDYVRNPPSDKELAAFYDRSEWFEGGEAGGYADYDSQTESSLALIKEFLATFSGERLAILDIGCGYGNHLEIAASLGWECFGIEPSDHARNIAISRLGSRAMIVKSAEELIPHAFDVVLMLDVVEHVIEPQKLFYPLFALGGISETTTVLLTTPNAGSNEAIHTPETWQYRHPPSHLVFYNSFGLEQLFHNLRFRDISVCGIHPKKSGDLDDISNCEGLKAVAKGSDFQAFMHERYVPSTWSEIAEYEHFPRYEFACRFATGLKVLDFGCGTGYGTAMLAAQAESALGVDIDATALEWAGRFHRLPNLSFQCNGDFLACFEDQAFDMVTCFEMIEHVSEPDQDRAIQALARVLRPQGLLLISTPNPDITDLYGANPYHLRERTRKEFLDLLTASFRSVQLLDQYALAGVFFSKDPQLFALQSLHGGPLSEAIPLAYVAVCSHGPLPPLENRGYLDAKRDYISFRLGHEKRLVQARLDAYAMRSTVVALENRIAATVHQISALSSGATELEQARIHQISTLSARATELATRAAELERMLDMERRSRWARLGDQLRATGLHRSTAARGALSLAVALRRQVMHRLSPPSGDNPWSLAPVALEASDQAYTVRQPESEISDRPIVLHAIANFCLGGSSRLVIDLIESLGVDFKQVVITRYIPRPPAYLNLTIHEYAQASGPAPFNALIDRYKPVLVHVHYWGDCDQDWYEHVFRACEISGVPVIQNINTPVTPYISSAIQHNVYVSEYVRQIFGEHDEKAMVIHPGSDLDHFCIPDLLSQADDCIGMVYRLESDKLNSSSIDVFIKVAQRRPATRCLIVGDGSLKPVFETMVAKAGISENFIFTGYVPYQDLPSLYHQMSLFVAPVWKESFGQVSSFAMNMGLPVVGYAVGAIPSIIADEQLLAPYGDSEGLASLIIDLLDNRQRRLDIGLRNHERAQADYSVTEMVKSYANLYRSVSAYPVT
jgi:glycosyltransferase involved in cell wall biosynthesis/2-polyprenyl-3-methyl-5-hydroxy-6-metoxy-1,4-benzoquinol methylase